MREAFLAVLRAFVGLFAATAMILAPIQAQAAPPHPSALSYGAFTKSEFSMVPRDMDALIDRISPGTRWG